MLTDNALHAFLIAVLGIVSTVGILFTFALPSPSHKHKAQSATYARAMLFFIWVSFLCFLLADILAHDFYLVAFSAFLLVSAYCLFLTIIKRYGHGVTFRGAALIGTHLIAFVSVASFLTFTKPVEGWRELVLLFSLLIPVVMAVYCIRAYLNKRNKGDFVLLYVMLLTLMLIVFVAPAYVTGIIESKLPNSVVIFVVLLVLSMSFMLGFTVSVLHSLVIRLRSQAYTDPLTGAKNRHFFYEMAPKMAALAKRNHQQLSVVVCDIDHFKQVNDKFGHVAGDKALKTFSAFIQRELRVEDMLIRLGGEEFLILSPNCGLYQAEQMAERLRLRISEQEIKYQESLFTLTASFGVVELPKNGADIFKIIKDADRALYQAKTQGRNRVISYPA